MGAELAIDADTGHELMVVVTEKIDVVVDHLGHPVTFTNPDDAERFTAAAAPHGRRCETRVRRYESILDLTELEDAAKGTAA
jgi:hypothetical protein